MQAIDSEIANSLQQSSRSESSEERARGWGAARDKAEREKEEEEEERRGAGGGQCISDVALISLESSVGIWPRGSGVAGGAAARHKGRFGVVVDASREGGWYTLLLDKGKGKNKAKEAEEDGNEKEGVQEKIPREVFVRVPREWVFQTLEVSSSLTRNTACLVRGLVGRADLNGRRVCRIGMHSIMNRWHPPFIIRLCTHLSFYL